MGYEEERESIVLPGELEGFCSKVLGGIRIRCYSFFFFFFFPFFSLLFLGLRRGLGAIVVAMELHLTITAWV